MYILHDCFLGRGSGNLNLKRAVVSVDDRQFENLKTLLSTNVYDLNHLQLVSGEKYEKSMLRSEN